MAILSTDRQTDRRDPSPLISVIIPVYNTEEYLKRCLDSVLGNTYRNLEVICVNDGSTDGSLSVLREYAAADPRVRVIDQPNGGVSAARNAGLDAAAGEYISFVDSDDRVHRQYYEVLLHFALDMDADMIVCRICPEEKTDEKLETGSVHFHAMDLQESQKAAMRFFVHSKLYRHSVVRKIRFNEKLDFGEDTFYNLTLYSERPDLRSGSVDEALYYYLQRGGSLSHSGQIGKVLKISDASREKAEEGPAYAVVFLREAVKKFLDYRRGSIFLIGEEQKERNRCCAERRPVYRKMVLSSDFSVKERAIYLILLYFPILYRVWTIYNDPTMLDWERIQRQKRKKKRRNKGPGGPEGPR